MFASFRVFTALWVSSRVLCEESILLLGEGVATLQSRRCLHLQGKLKKEKFNVGNYSTNDTSHLSRSESSDSSYSRMLTSAPAVS